VPFDLLRIVRAKSKLELAGRIRKKWLDLAPRDRDVVPTAISISNRLGDLEREKSGWWESDDRPAARQAFEQVTGVSFRDLPLARDVILSPDFPRLRAFRPHDEAPLALGTADWFTPPGPADRRWIVTPPGAGRSFAVQWHRVCESARATEVARLGDASEVFDVDAPIVIGVDGPDADGDAGALARLDARGAVLVIAPFAPPRSPEGPLGPGHEPSSETSSRPGWSIEEWRPAPNWREAFVHWIASRIDDRETLLDADQLAGWLDRVDARCETFTTPGDIVALCAFAHESGVPSFRRDVADRFLRARIAQESNQGREGGTWLRAWGADVVRALVNSRLERVDLPLWGPLDRGSLADLLPADLAPRALTESEIDELLDRKRTPKTEARNKLRRCSAPEAIELLTSARLLRAQGTGLSLHPRWVGLGFARARVRREVAEGSPATWGRWAVDPERRELVDAELDDVAVAGLVRVSEHVVRDFDRTSLGAVGAVEATFAAMGRRLGPRVRGPDALQSLWKIQHSLLTTRYTNGVSLAPRTRPGFEAGGEWVACCWSWSLYGPKAKVDDSEGWLFPGWCDPSLAGMAPLAQISVGEPGWTGRESRFEMARLRRLQPPFRQLLEMSFEVVARCEDPMLPERVPSVLIPAVLLAAHRRTPTWSPSAEHVFHVAGSLWGGEYLAERATALAPDDRVAVAQTLWSALLGERKGAVYALDRIRQSPPLLAFAGEYLSAEDFAQALSPDDVPALHRLLDLPMKFRLPLVRNALQHRPDQIGLLHDVLDRGWSGSRGASRAGAENAPWIELLADMGRPTWIYRQALWNVAPERALARTLSADLTDSTAADWFHGAPTRLHATLLDHLARGPRPLPEWAVLWLRRRVLDAGAGAERAYALLEPP